MLVIIVVVVLLLLTITSTIASELTRNIMIIIGFKKLMGNKVGWLTSYIVTREHINIS